MKKVLSVLLILVMLMSIIPLSVATASADTIEYPTISMLSESRGTTFVYSEIGKLKFSIHRGTYALVRARIDIYDENNNSVCYGEQNFPSSEYSQNINYTLSIDTVAMNMQPGKYLVSYNMHFYDPVKADWYEIKSNVDIQTLYVSANGVIKDSTGWKYYENGQPANKTLLVKKNGKWLYVENGKWTAKTGLVKYQSKWFYINAGKWNSKTEALVKINKSWFLIKNGKWTATTGIVKYQGKDFYVVNGKWYSTKNTLYKKNGKFLAVKNGKWYKSKTIITYKGHKFYCDKGFAKLSFTGKVKIGSKTYNVVKGKIK